MISTEISTDTSALVDALVGVSPGASITYAELDRVIGRDVRKVGWLLQRARHVANRDHGATFAAQKGVGLVRLATDDLHKVGATYRQRIGKAARRGQRTIRNALLRANDIGPEASRKVNAELSILGLIEEVSKPRHAQPVQVHDTRPEPVAVVASRLFAA